MLQGWWDVFGESGELRSEKEQRKECDGIVVGGGDGFDFNTREIWTTDESEDEGKMMKVPGTRLVEEEVELLGDLLEGPVRYWSEERVARGAGEMLEHP